MSDLVLDGGGVSAGALDEDGLAQWKQHPAYQVLVALHRKEHGCLPTLDPSDPEDCAGVAAATIRALMQTGWLVPESNFQYAAVVDKRMHGKGFDVAKVRDTFERADTDRHVLAMTDVYPVIVMRRQRSGSRACGEWEEMPRVVVLSDGPGNGIVNR